MQRTLRLLASATVLFLAGCASDYLMRDAAPAPDEGLAVVRIVGNELFPWINFQVESVPDGDVHMLDAAPFAVNSSGLFVAKLPPGRYKPAWMVAQRIIYPTILTLTAPLAGKKLGEFEVRAGQVTNLGTVLYQNSDAYDGSRDLADLRQGFTVARDPTPVPTSALLRDVYPAAAPAFAGKPELGWASPLDEQRRAKVLAQLRERALGLNSPALAKSGALYVGARFGQVRARPALGAPWRSLDTGTLHEILAVLPLDDGRLLAGGEEGLLALSADQGRSWKRLNVAPTGSTVVFLGAAPDGAIHLVAELENELRVYSAAQPTGLWREVGRIPSPDEGMGLITSPLMRTDVVRWGRNQPRDFVAITRTRLVVYTTPHKLWSYEFATGKWETQGTPQAFFSLQATRDGFVYAVPGVGNFLYSSADWGRSWQRTEVPGDDLPLVFRDPTLGFASTWEPGEESKPRLLKTTDGAKSWSDLGEIGFRPQALLFDPRQRALVAVAERGRTLVSSDEGRTWRETK